MIWLCLHSLPISRAGELVLPIQTTLRLGVGGYLKKNLDAFIRKGRVDWEQGIAAASIHQSVIMGWSSRRRLRRWWNQSLGFAHYPVVATGSLQAPSHSSVWPPNVNIVNGALTQLLQLISFHFISHPVLLRIPWCRQAFPFLLSGCLTSELEFWGAGADIHKPAAAKRRSQTQ